MSKGFVIILIFITAFSSLSLLMVKPASAQTPKPSIPKFTLKVLENPYDVAPTTTINPNTGKTEQQAGYLVDNISIQVTIESPFSQPSFIQPNVPQTYNLWYNISAKNHYGNYWMTYPNAGQYIPFSGYSDTVVTYDTVNLAYVLLGDGSNATWDLTTQSILQGFGEITPGRQIDFRVQALTGSYLPYYNSTFTGVAGDWSPIQTITIPASSTSPTPTVPELSWSVVILLMVSMFSVVLLIRHRKTANLRYRGTALEYLCT